MNVRQNFKNLRNHTDYSFKNKQLFREKQNKVADIILLRISVIYIVALILIALIGNALKNTNLILFLLISLLVIVGLVFVIGIIIERPFFSYILFLPLIDIGIAYTIASFTNQVRLIFLFYVGICIIASFIFVFILPINIFRKLTPQLAFIPPIITIVSQTIMGYKNFLFNLMTNNVSGKVENMLFSNNYLTIKNKKDFVKKFFEMYNYILTNKVSNSFYNQLSVLISGLTLTFIIGGILITIRTHCLDRRANRKWKELIYSDCVKYGDLKECAYIGGTNYENLILNNPQYLEIIKNEEKDIEEEKKWRDRIRDKIKSVSNYINEM